MSLVEKFDLAIKNANIKNLDCAGYLIEGRTYSVYQDNESWNKFKNEMKELFPDAYEEYGAGGGSEMEEKDNKPPKMASFASSSRMIYLLARKRAYFKFEKQLPTTAGGTANLDGYLNCDDIYVFVEAKCHEPYNHSSSVVVGRKYQKLYDFLNEHCKNINIEMSDTNKATEMKTIFSYNGEQISHFDLKQMISHLCGIATSCIKGEYTNKPIEFLYLLYNPKNITDNKDILAVYNETCKQCKSIDLKELFSYIIDALISKYNLTCADVKSLQYTKDNFTFKLCDQDEFDKIIFE